MSRGLASKSIAKLKTSQIVVEHGCRDRDSREAGLWREHKFCPATYDFGNLDSLHAQGAQ